MMRSGKPTGYGCAWFEFLGFERFGHFHEELRHLRQRQVDLLALSMYVCMYVCMYTLMGSSRLGYFDRLAAIRYACMYVF